MSLIDPDTKWERWGLHIGFAIAILVLYHIGHLFFPRAAPNIFEISVALWDQVESGELTNATVLALRAIFIGFFLAVIVGVPLGLLMGLNRLSEQFFDPYLNALYVTPFSALVPALIFWMGTGLNVRVFVIFFFSLFPIVINTLEGAKTTPPDLLRTAQSYGASRFFMVRHVVIPHEIPYIVAGLRLGLGRSVKGLVIVELLVAVSGFGLIISRWSAAYAMEGVFSVVIVLMLLGVLFTWTLRRIENRLIRWDPGAI